MIPKELLKKIKTLEIKTRKIVQTTMSGEYHSSFKGMGINFAEVREYQVGDDVRLIDWKTTARFGHPFIKVFEEERELTVIIAVDLSGSGEFGSGEKTKVDVAAEIAAVLGFSAVKNNDKIGLLLFSDRIEKYVPPKKGKNHVLRLLRDIFFLKPESKKTSLKTAMDYIMKTIKKKAIVFLISDFIDNNYEQPLKLMNQKHEVIPILIEDERELNLPAAGILCLEDEESGEVIYINSNKQDVRHAFRNLGLARTLEQERFFKANNINVVRVNTKDSYIKPLIHYFKYRTKK
jgi:uncharacterized protein (DUF58 family)